MRVTVSNFFFRILMEVTSMAAPSTDRIPRSLRQQADATLSPRSSERKTQFRSLVFLFPRETPQRGCILDLRCVNFSFFLSYFNSHTKAS